MTNETTPARWSQRLQQIHAQLDKAIANNYDFYLKSVLDSNPMHVGRIMYKGREVRRIGK
jgi:hypothetical protein